MDKKGKMPGIKYAAALKYKEEENNAPRIVAFGKGALAEKIIQVARQNNIPFHEDPELACALSSSGDRAGNTLRTLPGHRRSAGLCPVFGTKALR
ncbi:MAG: EscU/YscU/HrcU family type III secretion system export apparatus switch protein [Dethiobacteria bacterium]